MYGDFTLVVFLYPFLHRFTTNKPRASFLSFFFLYTRQRWVECFDVAFFLMIPFLIQQHIKNRHLLLLLSTHNYDKTSLQWVIVNHNPNKTSWRTAKFAVISPSCPVPSAACARMMCSFLFAAFVFCLQHSFFAFFVCSVSFICNSRFLFAAYFFICSVSFLFAAFLFCLQRYFFVCSVSFLFAAFLFCLQRVPCGPS